MSVNIQIDCALHIANLVIRQDRAGQNGDADRAHTRLHALIDAQPDPDQFLISVARRLGRDRARALAVTEEVIALATA